MNKPSIPKGTRDFMPQEMARRNYIFDTIRSVFALYGFEQIETPALENLSTLMGKYGEEGDKLLFKVLNSGDWAANLDQQLLDSRDSLRLTNKIAEKGLRYDLTVPFARFVVQNREKIAFPFRRYQIQPVWRADRPQRGRYREFYQCDADVVGTDSLLCELELVQIVREVYRRLGIRVALKINNRKLLAGIAQAIGESDRMIDITVAIDKLDKIGLEAVNAELLQRGLSAQAVEQLQPILLLTGTTQEKLQTMSTLLAQSETGMAGIEELQTLFRLCAEAGIMPDTDGDFRLELDLTLARGLNYYTGAIFEVKALDVEMGSITGGGRYDNLTGIFGMPNVSGVGISFGADRIYDVLNQLDLYPKETIQGTQVLFLYFDAEGQTYALRVAEQLRQAGIRAEVYPEIAKMKRQLAYANQRGISRVAIVGETEMQAQAVMLRDMQSGEQELVTIDTLPTRF